MKVDLLKIIPKGTGNRITSTEINRFTNLCGATIRIEINGLRANAIPIASDRKGYFIAETPDELDHTIAQLNSRIHKMIVAREGLKKAQRLMTKTN